MAQNEKIAIVPVEHIDIFPDHPFRVNDDEEMQTLMDSIEEIGLQEPLITRKKEDGRYEIVSGHRRLYACQKLGLKLVQIIVRDYTRDEAIIAMVDSNLKREHILPSEKAKAYKMKMEAMSRQGKRTDLEEDSTSAPLVQKLAEQTTRASIGAENGESHEQVRRYIRLNELVPELLQLVDEDRIAFRPAVELSYLSEDEQRDLLETIESEEATPSLEQAIRMKKLSQEGKLDMDNIFGIMTEQKPNQVETVKFKATEIGQFFPERTPAMEMRKVILKLLAAWQKNKEKHRRRDDDPR